MALDARLHVRTDAQSNRHLAPTAPCPAIVSLLLDLQCWKPTLRSPSQLHTERVRPAHRCTFAADSIEFLDGSEQLADLVEVSSFSLVRQIGLVPRSTRRRRNLVGVRGPGPCYDESLCFACPGLFFLQFVK
jgi:hypothetical protein